MANIKQMVGAKVLDQAFAYIEGDPVENIPRMAKQIARIPGSQKYANTLSQVEGMMSDEKNPWRNLILRVLNEVSHDTVRNFVNNFIINASLLGAERAKAVLAEQGVRTPWAILMDPTSACNLRCIGCWAAEYKKTDSLSLETLDRIIREGKEIGTYFYIYSGGEPLMRKDDLIRLAGMHPDCMFLAFTNATLVDDKFAADLARVGNFALAISVEGEGKATDDRRGEGVYDKVIAAMDRLRKAKAPFGFSTCYHAKNVDRVADEKYLDFLIDKGCLFGWYFTYIPCGSDAKADLITPPDKRAMMFERVHDWRNRKPIFLLDFWNDGEYVDGCIAGGKSYFHINAAGDVEPCAFIHYSDVNIKDVSLVEALKSPLFAAYQNAQPFNKNHIRPCPLLDNPHALREIVHSTKARSTQPIDREDVDSLTAKCEKAAAAWAPVADALWKKVEPAYRMRKNISQAKRKEALEKVS